MRDTLQQSHVTAAASLAPQIEAAKEQLDRGRRLPPELAQAIDDVDLFHLYLPRSMGGPEVEPLTAFYVVEEISRRDGSVGWCTLLAIDASLFTGWLKSEVGKSMFGQPPELRGAVSFRPIGEARIVDGGYRVTGRWDYASGVDNANWLAANCKVMDASGPRLTPAGTPETRMVMFPAETATIHDTWFTMGMQGTGSNDFEAKDVFVPDERSWGLLGPSQEPGPLYDPRLFFVVAWTPVVANLLGMARGAMDAFVELATHSGSTRSTTFLRDRAPIQSTVGQAEAIIGGARAFVIETVGGLWQTLKEGSGNPTAEIAQARLAITHGMWESVRAVDLLFHAAGTNGIHQKLPLERFFRDVHVAVQHGAGLPSNYESGGQVFLGLQPPDPGW